LVGYLQREDSEGIIAMASRLSSMCAWARRLGAYKRRLRSIQQTLKKASNRPVYARG
jgi:hypothetical protein